MQGRRSAFLTENTSPPSQSVVCTSNMSRRGFVGGLCLSYAIFGSAGCQAVKENSRLLKRPAPVKMKSKQGRCVSLCTAAGGHVYQHQKRQGTGRYTSCGALYRVLRANERKCLVLCRRVDRKAKISRCHQQLLRNYQQASKQQ